MVAKVVVTARATKRSRRRNRIKNKEGEIAGIATCSPRTIDSAKTKHGFLTKASITRGTQNQTPDVSRDDIIFGVVLTRSGKWFLIVAGVLLFVPRTARMSCQLQQATFVIQKSC
jgi:hypothetical protein